MEGSILAELARTNSTLATAEMYTSGAISALEPPSWRLPRIKNLVSRDLKEFSRAVNLTLQEEAISFNTESAEKISMLLELRQLQPMPSPHY